MITEPCSEWREEISAFQDKNITNDKMKSLQEHLENCVVCRGWLAALEQDRSLFNNTYAKSAAGIDLRNVVLEELRMNTQQQKPNLNFITRPVLIFGGSFALLLLIIAFTLVGSPFKNNNNLEGLTAPSAISEMPVPTTPESPPTLSSEDRRQKPKAMHYDEIASSSSDNFESNKPSAPNSSLNERKPYDGKKEKSNGSVASGRAMTFSEMERNYGIPGGLKMAFTVNYVMEVKQALQSARKAQEIIKKHGGFSMDFQYEAPIGGKPVATFHGKIPAKEAASVIDDIEKLGQMRTVNIGVEDITDQYRNLEEQFNKSKGETQEYYKKELEKLALKHNLVDFSATFSETKVREPFTFDTLVQSTLEILRYILLALLTIGVALIVLALLISPFALLRHLRRHEKTSTAPEE